jgi:hypothetical protein
MAIKKLLVPGVVVGALGLALAACGGPLHYSPHGTARAPEADAEIEATVNSAQQNTQVHIRMSHLAPPDRLVAGGNSYVVWTRRNQSAQWMRIGTLAYNPGTREAELTSMAPDTAFELAVTVENTPTPTSPSPNVVLAQRVGSAG